MSAQWLYGVHAVKALLQNGRRLPAKLWLNQARQDATTQEIQQLAQTQGIPLEHVALQTFTQQFGEVNHQGVAALVPALPVYQERDIDTLLAQHTEPKLILILDGVTDPHNLGACLRSADAAGGDFVIIPKDKSASITPVVSKVACGAAEHVPVIQVTNLVRAIERLKTHNIWLYGAAGQASQTLYQTTLTGSVALVLGAEGQGLRRLTSVHCDYLFSIPMQGCVESLNVSVAAGVALYEVVRQRLK